MIPSRDCDAAFLAAQNPELYEALMAELKQRTSGRWHWDQIDYCWTGKDADLDWHSYQDLHVDFIDDTKIRALSLALRSMIASVQLETEKSDNRR